MSANLIIAFMGAAGVFASVLALGMRRRVEIKGVVEPSIGLISRLSQHLTEADLHVTAGEFLRTSLLLGVGIAVLAYLLTTTFTAALLGLVVGGLVYYTYLVDRRDRRRQEYQDGLVDVIGLLVEGFKAGNTLQAAFETVAQYGPEIVREDWSQVTAKIRTGTPVEDALKALCEQRRDPILDTIVKNLVVVKKEGGQISVALEGLEESVRERVRIRRRVRAEQNQPLWELRLVSALPFLVVPILRATAEEYIAFWQTPLGQMFLLVAWGLTIVGFVVAQRYITASTRVEESFGAVAVGMKKKEVSAGLPPREEEDRDVG